MSQFCYSLTAFLAFPSFTHSTGPAITLDLTPCFPAQLFLINFLLVRLHLLSTRCASPLSFQPFLAHLVSVYWPVVSSVQTTASLLTLHLIYCKLLPRTVVKTNNLVNKLPRHAPHMCTATILNWGSLSEITETLISWSLKMQKKSSNHYWYHVGGSWVDKMWQTL